MYRLNNSGPRIEPWGTTYISLWDMQGASHAGGIVGLTRTVDNLFSVREQVHVALEKCLSSYILDLDSAFSPSDL